jgi:hypothetical protein
VYFISAGLYIASFGDTIAYYCIWIVALFTVTAFLKKKIQ